MKKLSLLAIITLLLSVQLALAVDPSELYRKMIPEDKKLDPAWVQSLTERGHALDTGITGSKKNDSLKYIGMTVGGIGCGTVYLNGDGRLFVWDIWGLHQDGVVQQTIPLPKGYPGFRNRKDVGAVNGATFLNPPTIAEFPPHFSQGFGIQFEDGSLKKFEGADWETVDFKGQWPIGNVSYTDSNSPVSVELKAYSPFIPLDLESSSIPVTVMSYTVKNTSDKALSASLVGWLDDMSNVPGEKGAGSFTASSELSSLSHDCSMQIVGVKPKRKKAKAPATIFHKGSMALSYLGEGTQTTVNDVSGLSAKITLEPGESKEVTFLISWYFPDIRIKEQYSPNTLPFKNEYSVRFKDAVDVANQVATGFSKLSSETQAWVNTWNDSTLPQWLLDRTALTSNTLQTANCFLLNDNKGGRFWAWEGIGVCHGTCTHVWHYGQGMARLFPSLERNLREKTDYGFAQLENGVVPYRAKLKSGEGGGIAIDGQCGTVLRSYREHLMSKDSSFLETNWADIKRALNYLIEFDRNDGDFDGLLHGKQHNTLDASWYGKVHAITSLYIASLRAGEEMATRMNDTEFTKLCQETYAKGSKNIEKLYNGEYYIQEEDPAHPEAIGVGKGVYIDQVIGQFWANQLGLGRLYNKEHIQSSLNALWKHNFVSDVATFRETFRKGRYYAWDGDAGLIMCSWPNGGVSEDFMNHWQYDYFNECMSGFEYQAAAHMVAENTPELITQGLAITRAIHDRYASAKRNPYNEVECSDHYARAMASYAVFLAVCGFDYDGPAGMMSFAPVIGQEDFRAPFTAAEGWGTFSQKISEGGMSASISVNWGSLNLNTLKLNAGASENVSVSYGENTVEVETKQEGEQTVITFPSGFKVEKGNVLNVTLK